MNKDQLKARCTELGIDTEALDKANEKGKATNAELKAAIDTKEAELHTAALKEKAADLGIETEGLDNEKIQEAIDQNIEFNELKLKAESLGIGIADDATIESLKADIKVVEDASVNNAEEVSAKQPTWKDQEGRVWQFHPKAPKTINIDGRPRTQAEILESDDIISELAYGNSSFLTQKH